MSNEQNQPENPETKENGNSGNSGNTDQSELKVMTQEEAQKLTDLCSKQADQFLQHIRPYFANREAEYGTQWALENYMRMALLPGIYVVRQSLTDNAIKEMMPLLEKIILEYKIVKTGESDEV